MAARLARRANFCASVWPYPERIANPGSDTMRSRLIKAYRRRRDTLIERWLARRHPPETSPIRLHRRRLYILPSRLGWIFATTVLALLIGSLNYETSLGFGATFLLAGIGIVGMHQTYRNLLGLELRFGPAPAVYAGGTARFPVQLDGGRRNRWGLFLGGTAHAHVPAGLPDHSVVPVSATRRGRLAMPRMVITTLWPVPLFRVWSWTQPRVETLVYPRPVDHGQPLPRQRTLGSGASRSNLGHDEFAGLREYHAGDPPRRIAWKTFARTDELHTKSFSAEASGDRVFDWFELGRLGPEERLEQITYWINQAEARQERYALQLPGATIAAGQGDDHRRRCLEALALHGEAATG